MVMKKNKGVSHMGKEIRKISVAVIKRLPKYYRYLGELIQRDVERISSKKLSKIMGLTASQIRQDLNNFGGFGQQGYGYNVKDLYKEISKILGLHNKYNFVIIGAGNLGQAIANYHGFSDKGFVLKGIFDINPKLIGMRIHEVEVMDIDHLEEFIYTEHIDIAVICVPKGNAQDVADKLNKTNIKGIWNFAPVDLKVRDDIILEQVHLSDSLMTLSYKINEKLLKERQERRTKDPKEVTRSPLKNL